MGGRGTAGTANGALGTGRGSGSKEERPYSEHNGVRTYFADEAGAKAFIALSGNTVSWNKGSFITKEGESRGVQVKRGEMWDYLKKRNINSFIVRIEKGNEKRALKQLSDYGYNVKAKSAFNAQAKSVSAEVRYFVEKKEMQYLDLNFKKKTYFKRGWKG